jgi:hypothetical protein
MIAATPKQGFFVLRIGDFTFKKNSLAAVSRTLRGFLRREEVFHGPGVNRIDA